MSGQIIVPPAGPSPCDVLVVGEGPGAQEARERTPFVGPSGQEQAAYFRRGGADVRSFRRANVIWEYIEGNPDPTPELIAKWSPVLEEEIARTAPRLIIAVGRFAMRWFLGEAAELDACQGLPHRAGCFDPTLAHRGGPNSAIVIPVTHPAAGLYDPASRAIINWGYGRAAEAADLIRTGRAHRIQIREDEWAGRERYVDVGGHDLSDWLAFETPPEIGLDTEGTPDAPWSIQVSPEPGRGYVLRCSRPDFAAGVAAIQHLADRGALIITHDAGTPMGTLYDTQMCRAMGLELGRARVWNTMYAAYLLRLEPKGLKPLMWRWCGMRTEDYMGLVGDAGRIKQVAWLTDAAARTWPAAEPFVEAQPDGTLKVKKPKSVRARIENILRDVAAGKCNKDGVLVDPWKRWREVEAVLRAPVEKELGPMPQGTLDDVDLERAVFYAGRDADATLRLKRALTPELERMGLADAMTTGNEFLQLVEEMQREGMPASYRKFQDLATYVDARMRVLRSEISTQHFDGRPFNPASPNHVRLLMRRRGLRGAKMTDTGEVSTGKKSIQHHEHTDPAIGLIFKYREAQKVKSTYCDPLLRIAERQGAGPAPLPDTFIVRCKFKPVSVETRRLAAEDPSLLNQPTRTELGRRVRACYVVGVDGEVFGAWDFAAQEMRVAAHVSEDPLLCDLFSTCRYCGCDLRRAGALYTPCPSAKKGVHEAGDPHTAAAIRIFGVTPEQVGEDKFKKDYRMPAKTANFGILYGLSGAGLLDQFRTFGLSEEQWPLDRCQELIDEILHKVYPGLSRASAAIQAETRRTGMVRDLFGMIRYLPAIWSRRGGEAAEAGRQAFSHVIQGTAQGMMQKSMCWLKPRIRALQDVGVRVRWALQVHDEVIFLFPREEWEVMHPLVTEALVEHHGIRLRVPIEAEGKMAESWAELK